MPFGDIIAWLPWAANARKGLVRTPKVYLRDSGLLHGLLDIPNLDGALVKSHADCNPDEPFKLNRLYCVKPFFFNMD